MVGYKFEFLTLYFNIKPLKIRRNNTESNGIMVLLNFMYHSVLTIFKIKSIFRSYV